MNELVNSLCCASSETVLNALIELRKRYFNSYSLLQSVKRLRENGGLRNVFAILRTPNPKNLELALSIADKCCVEAESRKLMANPRAISSLISIIKSIDIDQLQNRACRILANLSPDDETIATMHNSGAVATALEFLQSATNSASQQSAIRVLKWLANSAKHCRKIMTDKGLDAIASHLDSENKGVLISALHALDRLTRHCPLICERISRVVVHVENSDQMIRQSCVRILTNLLHQSEIRPLASIAAAIPHFVKKLNQVADEEGHEIVDEYLTVLSLYCSDAINRSRVQNYGGLETLMSFLRNPKHEKLHDAILKTVAYFVNDDHSWAILLKLNLLSIVTGKMAVCTEEMKDKRLRSAKLDAGSVAGKRKRNCEAEESNCPKKIRCEDVEPEEKIGPDCVHYIMTLLFRLSQLADLASLTTIDFLMELAMNKQNPKTNAAATILLRLASNQFCFRSLLNHQFPRKIYSLDDSLRKTLLTELARQAESRYGVLTIQSALSMGSHAEKQLVAFSLPYVILDKRLRQSIFLQHGALELIFDALKSPGGANFESALLALFRMSWPAKQTRTKSTGKGKPVCDCISDSVETDVCFVLDGGETVSGNRCILAESSDMFAAMLMGQFREASQTLVKFGNASERSMRFIVHFLHGCKASSCPVLIGLSANLLFEVAGVADRLLLLDLKENVCGEIKRRFGMGKVSGMNAAAIYRFLKVQCYDELMCLVMDYLFGELRGKVRFVSEAFRHNLGEDLLLEMKKWITERLRILPKQYPWKKQQI